MNVIDFHCRSVVAALDIITRSRMEVFLNVMLLQILNVNTFIIFALSHQKEDPTKNNPRFWDELFLMKVGGSAFCPGVISVELFHE